MKVEANDFHQVLDPMDQITITTDKKTETYHHPAAGDLEVPATGEFMLNEDHIAWLREAIENESARLDILNVDRFNWQQIDTKAIQRRFQSRVFQSKHELVKTLYYETSITTLAELHVDPRIKLMDLDTLYQRLSTVGILKRINVTTELSSPAGADAQAAEVEERLNAAEYWLKHEDTDVVMDFLTQLFTERPETREHLTEEAMQSLTYEEFIQSTKIQEYLGRMFSGAMMGLSSMAS